MSEIENREKMINTIVIAQHPQYWIVWYLDEKGKRQSETFDSFEAVSKFVEGELL